MSRRHERMILHAVRGTDATQRRVFTRVEGYDAVYAAYAIQGLQDEFVEAVADRVESDIVVWFRGRPSDPAMSRVGGQPFWPKAVEWPRDRSGNPLLYLAQVCLEDSRDVLPSGCDWTHVFWFQDDSVDVADSWAMDGCLPVRAIGIRVDGKVISELPATHTLDIPEHYGALIRARELRSAVKYSKDIERTVDSRGFAGLLLQHIAAPPFTKIGGLPPLGAEGVGDGALTEWPSIWDGRTVSICQIRLPKFPYPWGSGYAMLYQGDSGSQCAWVWE